MPAGRPTVYNPDKMIPRMLEMAKEGCTMVQVAADFGVCRDTISEWKAKHSDFSLAFKEARLYAEAFWTARLAKATIDPDYKGNANLLKFYISAQFGWSERTEVKQDITSNGKDIGGIPVLVPAK